MRQLIAGNWKMNGTASSLDELRTLCSAISGKPSRADVLICPPATLIARAVEAAGSILAIGAQDCSSEQDGAFTGDISAGMLKDSGAKTVIVGHSERRQYHHESSELVARKAAAAQRAGLTAIVCVGEKEHERDAGNALSVCGEQLAGSIPAGATPENTVVAYEPVWAIGTGRTPSAAEIVEVHRHIRACVVKRLGSGGSAIRILYGGSVKPSNAAEILGLPDVDGALVGGASLKAQEFLAILSAVATKR
jgi:triosephosphate isomerase